MKKQIKLYLHHSHYEPVSYSKRTGLFGATINLVVNIFYLVGLLVISVVKLPWQILMFIINLPKKIPKVGKILQQRNYQKNLALFSLLVLIMATAVHGLVVISIGQDLKGQVLGASTNGIGFLKDAQVSLQSEDPVGAQANFAKALQSFKESEKTLNSTGIVLKGMLSVVPQKQDADKLLSSAEKITQAAIYATELIQLTDEMKLSAVGLSGGDKNQKNLEHARDLLNQTSELASEASTLINSVSINSLPEQYHPAFIAAKDAAKVFLDNSSTLKEVSSLTFDLLLGQKSVLIVFENNNELRASGGFMGTIGNAKLNNGSIGSLDVRSVYDWDGQLKEKILPPQPIYAVNDRWYLRDSNWFGNFPDSASRISSFFEKEGGETPDLIVAMTPEVILDMLKITGPITLPQHGVTLNADNFVETTQTETSINYDKELNQPKQFLADFFPLLMEKLGSNENGGIISFLDVFQKNLASKQILLYSRDSDIQRKISQFNWGGELRNTDRDYLSVISSNLGGTKTDRFLTRDINLKSKINDDGTITNTLQYVVQNPLQNKDGLNNKSFLRFFVPQGAKLVSSSGFNTEIQLPRLTAPDYVLDAKVQNWQSGVTQDLVTGTYTGSEANKTWFGNWLDVRGGESKTVSLTYTLPFKLSNLDRLSLLIQKQAGSLNEKINYEVELSGWTSLWNSNDATVSNDAIKYNKDLTQDQFIGTVIQK